MLTTKYLVTLFLTLYGTTHAQMPIHDHTHPTVTYTHSSISGVVFFFPVLCKITSYVALLSRHFLYHHDLQHACSYHQ